MIKINFKKNLIILSNLMSLWQIEMNAPGRSVKIILYLCT